MQYYSKKKEENIENQKMSLYALDMINEEAIVNRKGHQLSSKLSTFK